MVAKKQKFRDPVTSPVFRAQFVASLIEPKYNDKGKPQYSVAALFPKGIDVAPLERELTAAVTDQWPALGGKLPPKSKEWPIKPQSEFGGIDKDTGEFFTYPGAGVGEVWTRFVTHQKPTAYDAKGNEIDLALIEVGDYCRARVIAHPYSNESTGVRFMLNSVQLVAKGEKFQSNRPKPRNEFDVVTDEEAAKISADSHFGD